MISRSSMPSTQTRIELHIERLVVDESLLAPGQQAALQTAVETELVRMLAERGVSPCLDAAVPSLTAGNIRVADRSNPARIGRQIAQSVYATFGPVNPLPAAVRPSTGR